MFLSVHGGTMGQRAKHAYALVVRRPPAETARGIETGIRRISPRKSVGRVHLNRPGLRGQFLIGTLRPKFRPEPED